MISDLRERLGNSHLVGSTSVCIFEDSSVPSAGTSLIQWQLNCYIMYFVFKNSVILNSANVFYWVLYAPIAQHQQQETVILIEYAKSSIQQHSMAG